MIPQTPRHDFLHELHKLLRPATYLEIGVQTGRSLAQAIPPTLGIGVDPDPQIAVPIPISHGIFSMTSDNFFAGAGRPGLGGMVPVDLAFIDGMHLVENCLRDFIGVEKLARPDGRTVVVFDDVLPYSADIAGRTPLPGDWAGDCWKIFPVLDTYRFLDLTLILVNVAPTGALVVLGPNPIGDSDILPNVYDEAVQKWARDLTPTEVSAHLAMLHRSAVGPVQALDIIRKHLNITEA